MRWLLLSLLLFAPMATFGAEVSCEGKASDADGDIAQILSSYGVEENQCLIGKITGRITEGDSDTVEKFLAANPSLLYLDLNLIGGEVHESMKIGRLARKWSLFTFAVGSDTCSSSCILIWLAGAYREADSRNLKAHRFYLEDEEFRRMSGLQIDSFYNSLMANTRNYLSEMGVDADQDKLLRSIMTTPPEELEIINRNSHPRLFGAPSSRDQWIRANGCRGGSEIADPTCVAKLVLRDRHSAGLLPPD